MIRSISSVRFELGTFEAMAPEHPNRHRFTGVLCKVGQPSDNAPVGSSGKRVLLTRRAAEAALPSLLGMGIGSTPKLDGHDPTRKIGVITAAEIDNYDLKIEGFFYAHDLPDAVARIRANRAAMGFSFEAQRIVVEDMEADPLVITACVFTGAAVLQKSNAAYLETSLAASAAGNGRRKSMEANASDTIQLDPYTLKILRDHNVNPPYLNLRAGSLDLKAAADHSFEDFDELVAQKIPGVRERIQVKMAIQRALGNSRGVTGHKVGMVG